MEFIASQVEYPVLEELKLHVTKPTTSYVNSQIHVTLNATG